ncbi:MAG: SMI1/KNR4 family protein [Peptococcaceae bacterium]|nr:SMI1/KNR4 family protein [Peptococcaceae bacterium]
MDQKIITMIEEYATDKDFWGKLSEQRIRNVEGELKITFPEEYREFLAEYGAGGVCGEYIEGIQGDKGASVVTATEKWREFGLPENAFVVLDVGEYAICMLENGKVYSWTRGSKALDQERYVSFYDFVNDYFQEAIDNF